MVWTKTGGVPADTTAEAARLQRAAFAHMPPAERLQKALELSEATRQLAAAGLRKRLDLKSDEQVREALIRVCYGSALPDGSFPT